MTPKQFRREADAWDWRDQREWERAAAIGRWVMSTTCGKDTPSINQLLGREPVKDQ